MPQFNGQKLNRRKTVALFFVVGFAISAAINLLWAYSSLYGTKAFLTVVPTPIDFLAANWSYSILLPLMLAISYTLAVRWRWLSYSLVSVERALISILILVIGWNFYQSANLLSVAIFNGYRIPSPLISCIYALMIAFALFTFTGVWDRISAVGLVIVLTLSPLLIEVSLISFGELGSVYISG